MSENKENKEELFDNGENVLDEIEFAESEMFKEYYMKKMGITDEEEFDRISIAEIEEVIRELGEKNKIDETAEDISEKIEELSMSSEEKEEYERAFREWFYNNKKAEYKDINL